MDLLLPHDEEAAIRDRFWNVRRGQVVLDVGSFEGTYALPALAAGATVYAVDARAWTLVRLREMAEVNGIDRLLVTVHAAVCDGGAYPDGLLENIAEGSYPSARDMVPDDDVQWTTIDALAESLGHLDWIKVDVEGGELGVLRGAQDTLRRLRPRLLIEDHERVYPWVRGIDSTRGMLDVLHAARYDWTVVQQDACDYLVADPR